MYLVCHSLHLLCIVLKPRLQIQKEVSPSRVSFPEVLHPLHQNQYTIIGGGGGGALMLSLPKVETALFRMDVQDKYIHTYV